jgi:hypothetical protein
LVFAFLFTWVGCSRQTSELKPIQQQQSGDFVVTLLNETGSLKHSDYLTLEFRKASSNELVDVTNVQIQASMLMPGMGPMFGTMSSIQKRETGTYDFKVDLGMAGQWNMVVTFDPNGRAQFSVKAQ